MKKVFTIVMGAGMLAFLACGPSAQDIEAKKQDSIHKADSAKAVAEAEEAKRKHEMDSIAQIATAAVEKAKQDSTRMADSLAAISKKPGKAPKKAVVVPKTVTAPGGRPGATKTK